MPSAPAGAAQPSAAAAAGAAAAALLQRQLLDPDAGRHAAGPDGGWTEHQTGDGRKFFFHEGTQTSTWEKPDALMTVEERSNDTNWREYRIWDGRVFYYNKETKTTAEKRKAVRDLMKEKGVDESWVFGSVYNAIAGDSSAQAVDESVRRQCFAELLGSCLRKRQIEEREKQRSAASSFERLIEDNFGRPEDLEATYEDAKAKLSNEEAWHQIKSDVRKDEVFQQVMERLEEKHSKARIEKRSERVLRLQRLIGGSADLTRVRMRWKDAQGILKRREELHEEEPTLDTLRVWSSLRDLRLAAEHDMDGKVKTPAMIREERKRRDAFVAALKDMVAHGAITADTDWPTFEALTTDRGRYASDPRLAALRHGPGATSIELLDEFQEQLRQGTIVIQVTGPPPGMFAETSGEPLHKRMRTVGPEAAVAAAAEAAMAVERAVAARSGGGNVARRFTSVKAEDDDEDENISALDQLISGGAKRMVKEEPRNRVKEELRPGQMVKEELRSHQMVKEEARAKGVKEEPGASHGVSQPASNVKEELQASRKGVKEEPKAAQPVAKPVVKEEPREADDRTSAEEDDEEDPLLGAVKSAKAAKEAAAKAAAAPAVSSVPAKAENDSSSDTSGDEAAQPA